MIEIITERLLLIPCSLDLAKSLILHREGLEKRSPIKIQKEWPSPRMRSELPLYIELLEQDASNYGWGLWVVILYEEKKVIGDIVLSGKPDEDGCIGISLHMLEDEYAYESMDAMLDYLEFKEEVKEVFAECMETSEHTIELFGKLGLKCVQKEGSFLVWHLKHAM